MNTYVVPQRLPTEEIACGSHVPILTALATEFKPRNVIEFGSGLFSTPLFLNRGVFSELENLTSVENDQAWYNRVAHEVQDDPRHNFIAVVGEVHTVVHSVGVQLFDLVFLDDSRSATERCATIKAVAPLLSSNALAVIHDYEEQAYIDASMAFDHQFFFDFLNPSVGVCWNGDADHEPTLQQLRDAL